MFYSPQYIYNASCDICADDCHIDGLVQERCNSTANALELHFSCTNPLICRRQAGKWGLSCCLPIFISTNKKTHSSSSWVSYGLSFVSSLSHLPPAFVVGMLYALGYNIGPWHSESRLHLLFEIIELFWVMVKYDLKKPLVKKSFI